MELKFTSYAWEDYKYWEKQDSRTLKKINALIRLVAERARRQRDRQVGTS